MFLLSDISTCGFGKLTSRDEDGYHASSYLSQIGSRVVKAFVFQANDLGFNSPSGYKVGCPGHSKYMWLGQYEPSCLQFPSSVLDDMWETGLVDTGYG